MTPNFKELREELEEVFRYEERYRETGYIHPDVEDWEEAVWRNRFTILAALEIAERGQWVKVEERTPDDGQLVALAGCGKPRVGSWHEGGEGWQTEHAFVRKSLFEYWMFLFLSPEEK